MIENLIELFGNISARRRPGTLRLKCNSRALVLRVVDGRIIGVEAEHVSVVEGMVERLVASGVVSPQVGLLIRGRRLSPVQLREVLVGRKLLSESAFRAAKRVYELDLIYALYESSGEWSAEFQAHNVQPDPAASDLPSAGQILLDLLEYETDFLRYQQIFSADETARLVRAQEVHERLLENEACLWSMIQPACALADTRAAMLTNLERITGLLSLIDRNLIQVVEAGAESAVSDLLELNEESHVSLFSEIEAQLQFDGFDDLRLTPEEQGVKSATVDQVASQNVGSLNGSASALDGHGSREMRFVSDALESCANGVAENVSHVHEIEKQHRVEREIPPLATWENRLLDWNVRLTSGDLREPALLVLTVVWLALLLLASLMPEGVVERWFLALREFSSE